jgi:GT2 family glycosyltransferase/cytochrome c-type biogenesis protein CcmH/NrfG
MNDLAVMYSLKGRKKQAIELLEKLIKLDPSNLIAMKNLAELYLDDEQYEMALVAYQSILNINPEDVEALIALGEMYFYSGNMEKAKIYFEDAVRIDPKNSIAIDYLNKIKGNGKLKVNYGEKHISGKSNIASIDVVCIAGMHRSGTSMVTRILNQCGLYLGPQEKIMPPGFDNPEGFWENIDFVAINDKILAFLNGAWDYPPKVDDKIWKGPELEKFRNEARRLIDEFKGREPWGWKDPRNSLTLPFWKQIISDLKTLIIVRNPLDVALSIHKRNHNSIIFGLNLWFEYNKKLLEYTEPEERLIVEYEAFFENPEKELERILRWLNWDVPHSVVRQACGSVKPSLRHNRSNLSDLKKAGVPDKIIEVYLKLLDESRANIHKTQNPKSQNSLKNPMDIYIENGEIEAENPDDKKAYAKPEIILRSDTGRAGKVNSEVEKESRKLYKFAVEYLKAGFIRKATEILGRVINLNPEFSDAIFELGLCLYAQKQRAQGIDLVRKAVELNPDNLTFKRVLAKILIEQGFYEEGIKLYIHLLGLNSKDVEILIELGKLYAEAGNKSDAIVFLNKALEIDPSSWEARSLKGKLEGKDYLNSSGEIHTSIIIPVFNQVGYTKRCLETLYSNTLDRGFEVIVVDNASTDGTQEFLNEAVKRYPNLRVIRNSENLKFARACNQGANIARGKYLVFLNNDTEPQPGWLTAGIRRLESDPDIGIVASKLLYPDRTIQHCGVIFTKKYCPVPAYPVWPIHRYRFVTEHHPAVNRPEEIPATTAACLFISSKLFKKVGGFTEDYGMYFEDTDLCLKVRRHGRKIFYEPKSVVIHYEGKSSPDQKTIDKMNLRAASIFFPRWESKLLKIQLELAIEKRDGKFIYFNDEILADIKRLNMCLTEEEKERLLSNFIKMFRQIGPFYVHFGGAGDALLLLSTFYDKNPAQTIVSIANSPESMRSFFDAFPMLKKIYFIPFPDINTHALLRKIFANFKSTVLGMGVTPEDGYTDEWVNSEMLVKKYKVNKHPLWVKKFRRKKIQEFQVVIAPKGSVTTRFNLIDPNWWFDILKFLNEHGIKPIILGTPDERDTYPATSDCIDKRSYSFEEQMRIIASSDIVISVDTWVKTFSALAGIPTIVFKSKYAVDLKDWKDPSDYIFIDPWKEITVVENLDEFKDTFIKLYGEKHARSTGIKIKWEGSQFVYHSLALINREICKRLIEANYDVSILPYEIDQFKPPKNSSYWNIVRNTNRKLEDVDIHVRHQWPIKLDPPERGRWVIIFPWELTSIPKKWAEVFSTQVDEIWVPSNFVKEVLINSGVPEGRVFVVPNGVDPGKFNPGAKPFKLKTRKKFKFLFVGGTLIRKGIDLLLEAYLSTFTKDDDVCLVIKDMLTNSLYKGVTFSDRIKELVGRDDVPEIEYIEQMLPEVQLPGLYTACDVLVHPYRGEGFGLPILEAMACGLPVIVTGGGSCLDFCNPENSLLVKATLKSFFNKEVKDMETVDYPHYFEVDINDLKEKMLYAYKNREKIKKIGQRASEYVLKNWTWDHTVEKVKERINKLVRKNIVRFEYKPKSRAEHMYEEAQKLIESGRIDDAIKILEDILKTEPKHTSILNDLGVLYSLKGDRDKAIETLKKSISVDPKNLNARKNLAEIYIDAEMLDEALRTYMEIIQIEPSDVEALIALGEIYFYGGNVQDARRYFERVLRVDPGNKIALDYMSKIDGKLVSIIIPVYNQLEYTKGCIKSIRKYTNIPYELIVIDNASTDGTYEYLNSQTDIRLIRNEVNLGFPKAVNQGISIANGNYILIMNNDVVVTRGWLENLISHIDSDKHMGIVAPMSNYASGAQLLKGADKLYSNEDELQKFAEYIYRVNMGRRFEIPHVTGLCMLIKREVIDKIGGFDERFSPGNFEDDDFCLRAKLAGFKIAIAEDVFIHHFGSKSFTAEGVEKFKEILERNRKLFIEKWGGNVNEILMGMKKPKRCELYIPLKTNLEVENAKVK